jgi:nitrate reductase NapE component
MSMVANRNSRTSWTGRQSTHREGETPYELVAVCMWSVLGVALVALVLWLALGGTI